MQYYKNCYFKYQDVFTAMIFNLLFCIITPLLSVHNINKYKYGFKPAAPLSYQSDALRFKLQNESAEPVNYVYKHNSDHIGSKPSLDPKNQMTRISHFALTFWF